jgi:hypothetical protein
MGDNIKMDLREMELVDMCWIGLTQGRDQWMSFVNTVMNLIFLSSYRTDCFSRISQLSEVN